jgi:hypothetical protein
MLGESLNENLNPEVSNAVNRFIKAMAKRMITANKMLYMLLWLL